MVYVLFPTAAESGPFAGMLDGSERAAQGMRHGVTGRLYGAPVTVLVSGVGQANTAQAVTAVLCGGGADAVILGGTAGAYEGTGLAPGDVVVVTEEVFADTGVATADGWLGLEDIGLPLVEKDGKRYFGVFPASARLADAARDAVSAGACSINRARGGGSVRFGRALTVSSVTGSKERGRELKASHGGLCEDMEGAAAALVAMLYGAEFIEVRGISNMASVRDRATWDVAGASMAAAQVIARIIEACVAGGMIRT